MKNNKRVVITGIGVISSIGNDYESFCNSLRNGASGHGRITAFDAGELRSPYGCEVKGFNPTINFSKKEIRRMDRASMLCLCSVREAVLSSGIDFNMQDRDRCGVSFGSTLGGMVSGTEYYRRLVNNGNAHASMLLDYPLYSAGTRVCMEYDLLGSNIVISTACSSSNVAMGYAFDVIRSGAADIMVTGGFDTMAELTCSGFGVLRNISPDLCRPFDKNRTGLILGEGAACLILEDADHCAKRGGRVYAEFAGYGMSSDAYHMTAPDITAKGPAMAMRSAIENSYVKPDEVDYVNAHGTGTIHNDQIECAAIKRLFGEIARNIPVSSSKSMFGHTLGAAGAIEAVASVASIQKDFIPPTINYETPDAKCDLDCVPNESRAAVINTVLSNNFGFGGNNCSIIIRRFYE